MTVLAAALAALAVPNPVPASADDLPSYRRPGQSEDVVQWALEVADALSVRGGHLHQHGLVIARNDRFPDALAGATMAAARDGRHVVLYTEPDRLSPAVSNWLREQLEDSRYRPRYGLIPVYLLGGEASLSPRVASDLEALSPDFDIHRVYGSGRVQTSLAIASETLALSNPDQQCERVAHADEPVCGAEKWGEGEWDNPYWFDADDPDEWRDDRHWQVALARAWGPAHDPNGTAAWADSAALAAYAYSDNLLIILTPTDGLDDDVAAWLDEHADQISGTVVIAGGTAALSHQVHLDVESLGFDAERVAGPNRAATALALAQHFRPVHDLLYHHATPFNPSAPTTHDVHSPREMPDTHLVNAWEARGWAYAIGGVNHTGYINADRPPRDRVARILFTQDGTGLRHLVQDCHGRGSVRLLGPDSVLHRDVYANIVSGDRHATCEDGWYSDGSALAFCPTRTIHVAVNPDGAPAEASSVVDEVLDALRAEATGLQFVRDTTNVPGDYHDVPDFARAVADDVRGRRGPVGVIGLAWPSNWGGSQEGRAVLASDPDGDVGAAVIRPGITGSTLRRTLHHELGHAVGLDHTHDDRSIMHTTGGGHATYQPGDLVGLRYQLDADLHCDGDDIRRPS